MSCDLLELALPGVRALRPYQPGKSIEELQRELGLTDVVKLASNENPLGPAPAALQRLAELDPEWLSRYPDGNTTRLKARLAAEYGVSPEQLTIGNGSNDVLELVARAFVAPGDEVVFSAHAFAVYPLVTQAVGGRAVEVPARDWGVDLEAMAQALGARTRVVFLANPNNPTGTWFDAGALEGFLSRIPDHTILVLDEAYAEYMHPPWRSGIAHLPGRENLLVTRSFSKAYGLAGLRCGYGISSPQLADLLNRVRQPFNLNVLAMEAALAALDDEDFLARSKQCNDQGLVQLAEGFDALGLGYIPSAGNFICVELPASAPLVFEALLREGVITRPVANYGMPEHLRISVGTAKENQRFLEALQRVLGTRS
ncbi:MAG: histidinol-phosphate transaminase [Gammaproteobacteria bacterium]|nr:histidinol-phosphate transaminase [Gammaproteobacteria bacterium]